MKKYILVLLAVILISFGCSVNDDNSNNGDDGFKEMTDLDIKDSFNFETTRDVTVSIEVLYNGTFTIADQSGNVLHKSLVKINSDEFTVELPVHVSEVVLMYDEVEHMEADYQIENNNIEYSFVVEESVN